MWVKLAEFILRFRLPLIIVLAIATGVMLYFGSQVQMSYDFAKIMPENSPKLQEYKDFKKQFGQDGNILVIGMQSEQLFEKDIFNAWYTLGETMQEIPGVESVLSVPHSFVIHKNDSIKRFDMTPLVSNTITTQAELDSIKTVFEQLPFYQNLLYNAETHATLMAVTLDNNVLNSNERNVLMDRVLKPAQDFGINTGIDLKYSGLPYLKAFRTSKISKELVSFLIAAACITSLLLFLLFRSFSCVFFPMLVVSIGVIWTLGLVHIFGYEITLLTGIIPTLIVVIGIPNCVYLLNKYHTEYRKYGNKKQALTHMIEKIGYVTFFANLTTAIGLGVFSLMRSSLLSEFGIIAGCNVAATFVISLIVIPVVFSYLPAPRKGLTNHLQNKFLHFVLQKIEKWTFGHSGLVQLITIAIIITSTIGLIQLKSQGFIFDDLPRGSKELSDLRFFEKNFYGVMPFDIIIDTKRKGGATQPRQLKKIDRVQKIFEKDTLFSKPISIVEGIKFANQAFYNGNEKFYQLPSSLERSFIFNYLSNSGNTDDQLLTSLTDSSQQIARISLQIADIGSAAYPPLMDSIQQKVDAILDTAKYDVTYTGSSVIALEGYNYLINGLVSSVLFALFLISLIIAYLFRSFKMLIVALIPNLVPLFMTASIMGYFGIHLKPSTVIIFSIAFGISVDFTIHFLAKYRLELISHQANVRKSVSLSLRETGFSMIYTSIILFCGFVVFAWSSFEGTHYLGVLTSITIIVALLANLVLLPSILLYYEKYFNAEKMVRDMS